MTKVEAKTKSKKDSNGLAEQDWSYIEFNDFVTIRRQAGTGDRPRETGLVLLSVPKPDKAAMRLTPPEDLCTRSN